MSNTVLIIGESGIGKSSSIRTLDPNSTFIINVLGKPLPFKNAKKNYTVCSKDKPDGNTVSTDNTSEIKAYINAVNTRKPNIKTLIIDDFNYTLTNDFMKNAMTKGYDKYTLIAQNAWSIFNDLNKTRDDLDCFVLMHSDTNNDGKSIPMTIGKLINDKIKLEGMVTVCLHALIIDGEHKFLTQNDNTHMAKSPLGMFDKQLIDNDLNYVKQKIQEYLNEDIKQ